MTSHAAFCYGKFCRRLLFLLDGEPFGGGAGAPFLSPKFLSDRGSDGRLHTSGFTHIRFSNLSSLLSSAM